MLLYIHNIFPSIPAEGEQWFHLPDRVRRHSAADRGASAAASCLVSVLRSAVPRPLTLTAEGRLDECKTSVFGIIDAPKHRARGPAHQRPSRHGREFTEINFDHACLPRCRSGQTRRLFPRRSLLRGGWTWCGEMDWNQTRSRRLASLLRSRSAPPRKDQTWSDPMLAGVQTLCASRRRLRNDPRPVVRGPMTPLFAVRQFFVDLANQTRRSSPQGHAATTSGVVFRIGLDARATGRKLVAQDRSFPHSYGHGVLGRQVPKWRNGRGRARHRA
jgi:hypothetical protein